LNVKLRPPREIPRVNLDAPSELAQVFSRRREGVWGRHKLKSSQPRTPMYSKEILKQHESVNVPTAEIKELLPEKGTLTASQSNRRSSPVMSTLRDSAQQVDIAQPIQVEAWTPEVHELPSCHTSVKDFIWIVCDLVRKSSSGAPSSFPFIDFLVVCRETFV
jgi:hypothetical protein